MGRVLCWGGGMPTAPVPCSPSAPFVSFLPWPVSSQASVPTQEVMGTPARLNTHRWELAPSSLSLAGPTGKILVVAASIRCFPVAGCPRWSPGGCGAPQCQDAAGCCRLPTCSFVSCPESFPPSLPSMCTSIRQQWGEGAEALRGCSHPEKCWLCDGISGRHQYIP